MNTPDGDLKRFDIQVEFLSVLGTDEEDAMSHLRSVLSAPSFPFPWTFIDDGVTEVPPDVTPDGPETAFGGLIGQEPY